VRLPVELAERVFVVDVQPASAQSVSAEQIQP
jgi:hypothetical protein